jgi:hypothetical protein
VEAACVLHSKLTDQNNFTEVLDMLDCEEDRENVWVRIAEMKRQSLLISPKSLKPT